MLFKLSNLNSNLALTLGYLNPALNNTGLAVKSPITGTLLFKICTFPYSKNIAVVQT